MMNQLSFRLMGAVPLFVRLPKINTSIVLYGSPAASEVPEVQAHFTQKFALSSHPTVQIILYSCTTTPMWLLKACTAEIATT